MVRQGYYPLTGCEARVGHGAHAVQPAQPRQFEEQHYPINDWARIWGFSAKTIRQWFQDEYGPGILRHCNTGRRSKRDYTTIMISASAAARVYEKRTRQNGDA
jgi:hypothetical protein